MCIRDSNNSTQPQRVTLDLNGSWLNLLDGKTTLVTHEDGLAISLQPLEGAIFGRNNARSTVGGK